MTGAIADISGHLGPARDQGQRPTCMSFATSDVHQASRQLGKQLSTDALHHQAAKAIGRGANDGVPVGSIFDVLEKSGQVEEAFWPYGASAPICENPTSYRAIASSYAFDEAVVIDRIRSGFPVGLGLKVGTEFFKADGVSAVSLKDFSQVQAMHAVVLVGVRKGTDGIEFLVRNSWGLAWASAGHSWVESQYIASLSVLSFDVKAS